MKWPAVPLLPVALGIIVLGGGTLLAVMTSRPSNKPASPQPAQEGATLSALATIALRDVIEAQGLSCPNAVDSTLQGEDPHGQVVRVRCDNDQIFKVSMGPQGGTFHVAPWQ
jgi:hypothetical protein